MNNPPRYKQIGFLLGPILFFLGVFIALQTANPSIGLAISLGVWMVVWWVSEAVHIAVTALLPMAILPFLGIMDIATVCSKYAHPIVYLFFGGFVLALGLEKVNLHKRIALNILQLTGTKANGVVFGFMVATALLSMWISNTATTVMMMPIGLSILSLLINDADGFTSKDKNFALSLLLGIAFSANIGGTATLVGTPPNAVMLGILNSEFDIEIGFFQWMILGVPFAIFMLIICYLFLVHVFYPNRLGNIDSSKNLINNELQKLGPIKKMKLKY